MRTSHIVVVVFVLASLLTCAGIRAQQATKPAPPASAKKADKDVDIKAKFWYRDLDKKTVLFKDDVVCTHGDTVLTTDEILVREDTKTATCPGKVHITNPECDITGDKGSADFNKRLASLEGSVVMRVKPKQTDEKPDKDSIRTKLNEPTTISCPRLDYRYKAKIATGSGGVDFRQRKRSAKCEKVIYDEKQELAVLLGSISGVDEDGQTFSAPDKVEISLKKGNEWLKASNATATFKLDLDDEGDGGQAKQ